LTSIEQEQSKSGEDGRRITTESSVVILAETIAPSAPSSGLWALLKSHVENGAVNGDTHRTTNTIAQKFRILTLTRRVAVQI
jgi:hypothetical protein